MFIYEVEWNNEKESFIGKGRIIKGKVMLIENGFCDVIIPLKRIKKIKKYRIPEQIKERKASFIHHLKENKINLSLTGCGEIYENMMVVPKSTKKENKKK